MTPFSRLPVASVVTPPTPKPITAALLMPAISGAAAPPVTYIKPAPITIGRIDFKKPASGKPVSGLIDREPP
jgi:hypothetical protein